MKRSSVNTNVIHNARDIARQSLLACISDIGITAGTHHFVDLWARDSLFATFGTNALGASHVSKKTIQTFLRFQRPDGLVPYLVLRSRHTIGKYFGRHAYYENPVAHFRSHMSFGIVPDGGLMAVIAAAQYAQISGDMQFLKQEYGRLVAAFAWYETRFGNGLVREWFQCEWADALLKSGKTLYTNVLYFRAARDMAFIAERLGKLHDAKRYAALAAEVRTHVVSELWTGEYFADWKDWKRQDYFAVHPNMLAIIFGLATPHQAEMILSTSNGSVWNGWTAENSAPKYPFWRVPFFHTVIGMHDYHNGLLWLQPGILYAAALHTHGDTKKAKTVLTGIAEKIVSSGGAYEVYEQNGDPVRRMVYRSEHPFAWSAGLFVWACHILEKNL